MRARWVQHDRSMELPQGTKTIVATWWPRVYYLVYTLGAKADPDQHYVTEVLRCYKDGFPKSLDRFYRMEHADVEHARAGHVAAVQALAGGELKLKRIGFQGHDHVRDTLQLVVDGHRLHHHHPR